MNETLPLVTFIITTYNLPADYLRTCIKHVLHLTLTPKEREVIVVDDGSALSCVEELDDTLITASPALLKTSVIMLLQENVFSAAEFMDELSKSYGLSINATEVEYLLDLPAGTLAVPRIIEFSRLQIKRNNN